jgi:hypothetical protein
MTAPPADKSNVARIRAQDHLDSDGSVVRSGLLIADAVVAALHAHGDVEVSFEGVRGTPSSYFNVFLRRIEEVCGIAEIDNHIRLHFGSKVQKMIFDRSLESFRYKGPHNPTVMAGSGNPEPLTRDPPSLWARVAQVFGHRSGHR